MREMRNIQGLRIDWDLGEGGIKLPESFVSMYPMFRADVLRDWIFELNKLYEQSLKEMDKELNPFSDQRDWGSA